MRKIFMIATVLFSTLCASAQHSVGTISLQPKVGMNMANLTEVNGETKLGLVAGVECEYQITPMVGLATGFLYSMEGSGGTEFNLNSRNVSSKIKLEYINVPMVANIYVAKGLALKLGIQPSFKTSAKLSTNAVSRDVESDLDDVRNVNFSIPIGVSYENNGFVIDTRYNWGVTEVVKGTDSKSSVFQVTLGYRFDLAKSVPMR